MAVLEPGLIGVMGDIHGNTRWTVPAIREICQRLEPPRIILQAGDCGIWRRETEPRLKMFPTVWDVPEIPAHFPDVVNAVLEEEDAELWMCEGNHEDHDLLDEIFAAAEGASDVRITPRVRWLLRGYRWTWHDRTWLACGGAVSVDKLLRKEGISWFPQEEITDLQEEFVISGGPADVLLSHDAPSDVPLKLFNPPPVMWRPMIPRAEEHRDRLQRICVAVKPSYIFHGHYHQSQVTTRHAAWGKCRFTSLDMDGKRGNWGILDTRTMEWSW